MVKRIKLRVSVGSQNITRNTTRFDASYIKTIRRQMKTITDNYEKLVNELGDIGADIIEEALEPTFRLSQKYVPKDTGKLAQSGFLKQDRNSKFPRVVMGYGKGGDPNYTIMVHERMDVRHEAPTKAKFLLSALEEDNNAIERRIVRGYKKATGV